MGRFFTSTQIYNPKQLDRDGFKAYFCEKMKKEGYEVCEADCAELSYVLAFFENCKWVTLSSEAYEQGNRTAQADTARIAKMLGTYCVNTIVIDSDCAMLDLYNDKGKKADTLVMGRADDYLGDDIPAPAQAVWEQFVSPDSTWEQFMSVVQGDYVFVEDGLSEIAPVIGMDSDNILFEYEDADESNEKLCYLSFKKTASKKEKKPTLNSLFQQIWGAELEPLGFKKPKLRYPYYIRVINDEIIHVVGIHDMKSHLVAFGGIATVYRKELCLNHSFRQNEMWLRDVMDFYVTWRISDKPFNQEIQSGFHYHEYIESQPLSKAVQDALNETMTWIVPVLDNIKTLKDVADYGERVFHNHISIISLPLNESLAAPYSDAAIKFILDDPLADLEQRYLTSLKIVDEENIRYNRTQEQILRNREKYEQRYNESCKNLHMFLEDEEMHSQTLEELARRKKYNLEMLKSYGIDFEKPQPKKEKKLTINAAFKQVFGEALEPLGFIKAKTRHPCFLRAVGDEIIHVINLSCCGTRISTNSGVMTVYRPKIDLNDHKWDNKWLYSTEKFYSKINVVSFDEKYWNENLKIEYTLDNEESLINALKKALEEVKKWVLPILDDVKTVKDIIDYQHRLGVTAQYFAVCDNVYLNHETPCSDGAILFALDDPYYYPKRIKELLQTQLDFEIEHGIHFFGKETYEETCERFDKNLAERITQIDDVINNKHFYEQTIAELQRRKKANLEMLKSYGIDSEKPQPKKEKTLTLNSAFVKIFGETLEPLGFVKIKSKHPYFVRVVNGEILHVITYKTEQVQYPEDKAFNILCGVATIYRRQIDLNAGIKANYNWLRNSIADFYVITLGNEYDNYFRQTISRFNFFSTIESSLINVMKEASILTEKYVLPVINEINTLENCITFFLKYKLPFSTNDYRENINFNDCNPEDEGFLYIQADYIAKKNKLEETLSSPDINEIKRKRAKEIYSFFIESEIRNIALAELQRRKKANLEILKFYGIDFEKTQPKKEKKLTINAAFKKIYGNALIPLGFKWVKTKEPCFIRVINEEIIHIIGIHDMKPNFIVPFGGATTMYRADLMLNKTYRDTANWLPSVKQFWGWTHTNMDEAPDPRIGSKFYYLINSPDSIEDVVSAALRETIRWIMPALDSVQSLQDFLGYYEMCHNTILPFRTLPLKSTDSGNFEADAVIRYLLGNLSLQFEEYSTEIEKRQALSDAFNPNINTPDNIQYLRNRAKARNEAIHLSVISFENDPEVKQQAIVELQRRKKANLEILKSYGIDSEKTQPKKEKKLTLNAAFKQVFGELLEPMGFKLIKSKYPYYLRVVGEGIIQAISFAKKKSLNLDLNRDEEEVEIYVGISLLSNPLINFDKNPTIIDNQVWMISLNELYRRFIVYMDGFNRKHEEYSFFYQKGNIEEVLNALKQSRDELMPFVLEFLEKPKTLEDIYRLGEITSGIRHDTIILLQKIDELIKELKENLTKKIEMLESVHKDNPERLELLKKRAIEGSEKSIEYFGSFKKGGEKYDDYIKTAEETKEKNLKILESLEVI